MAQTRSQNYDIDNRYRETAGYSDIPAESAKDNSSAKDFLRQYIERDKVGQLNPIAPDNKDENKFVIPGQGGLTSIPRIPNGPNPGGNNISNTDARTTFRNSFRAAQS